METEEFVSEIEMSVIDKEEESPGQYREVINKVVDFLDETGGELSRLLHAENNYLRPHRKISGIGVSRPPVSQAIRVFFFFALNAHAHRKR